MRTSGARWSRESSTSLDAAPPAPVSGWRAARSPRSNSSTNPARRDSTGRTENAVRYGARRDDCADGRMAAPAPARAGRGSRGGPGGRRLRREVGARRPPADHAGHHDGADDDRASGHADEAVPHPDSAGSEADPLRRSLLLLAGAHLGAEEVSQFAGLIRWIA